jgi:hypothetical protein
VGKTIAVRPEMEEVRRVVEATVPA